MSLNPIVYKSTDPGAPQLSGTANALNALLYAVLVSGYGTGPDAKPGAGWTREYVSATTAVYRNSLEIATGSYLRVDDASGQQAFVRGYSAMTDIDTGEDPTPSIADRASGEPWDKSNGASAAARAWVAVATGGFFYLFIDRNDSFSSSGFSVVHPYYAGDAVSFKPGDVHRFLVARRGSASTASGDVGYGFRQVSGLGGYSNSDVTASAHIMRNVGGTPGSVRCCNVMAYGASTNSPLGGEISGAARPSFPLGGTYGLLYSTVEFLESAQLPRGRLPGIYAPLHTRPYPDMTEVMGVDGLPDNTTLLAKGFSQGNMLNSVNLGQVLIDITNPWYP